MSPDDRSPRSTSSSSGILSLGLDGTGSRRDQSFRPRSWNRHARSTSRPTNGSPVVRSLRSDLVFQDSLDPACGSPAGSFSCRDRVITQCPPLENKNSTSIVQCFFEKQLFCLAAVPYRVAISTEEHAFFKFAPYDFPTFIGYITNDEFFGSGINMVELESSLISPPTTISAFSSEMPNRGSFCSVPSDFSVAGAATSSQLSLIIVKRFLTQLTYRHQSSIAIDALPAYACLQFLEIYVMPVYHKQRSAGVAQWQSAALKRLASSVRF